MTVLNITRTTYDQIRRHLLFFISEERIFSSNLYEVIKISPGGWFDIEELAYRKSIVNICTDLTVICAIIKTLPEFEYNDTTGQIRVTSLFVIDDIVNKSTVIFYQSKLEIDEQTLSDIIDENDLTKLIVRFVTYPKLYRRDLRHLQPLFEGKVHDNYTEIIILKMANRIEATKIKKIINISYPEMNSCFAITNPCDNGYLSPNKVNEKILTLNPYSKKLRMSSSGEYHSCTSFLLCNYIYRANEYAVILDHLVEVVFF